MITNRIEELQKLMMAKGLHAYYINGSDPHMSEYMPSRWQTRSFMSGFTGSYGWVAITLTEAALWTDSRYFLQAGEQLAGSGIKLMKARMPETPTVDEWLNQQLVNGDRVGVDASCISMALFGNMQKTLSSKNIELVDAGDLLNEVWENRPLLPNGEIFELDTKYAGKNRVEKIAQIRNELSKVGADLQVLTALDDIAWTFNLRGSDVEFNPVFLSFAVISQKETILFVNPEKMPKNIRLILEEEQIKILDYSMIYNYLNSIDPTVKIYLDPDRTNQAIMLATPNRCIKIEGISIPCLLKAIKNQIEIANISKAMKKDGIAMLEFWYWLENTVGNESITEFDVAMKLTEFRQKQDGFKGISFFPIVGYKEHGAIVHLRVDENNALNIEKDGILLFDSGGHYWEGTTDTTRTVALGIPTERQKADFTLALQGVIALTEAKFPEQTRGYHLDILARKALWEHGLNYGHGTGHGVGFFLNVHEGPASIRMEFNDQTIKAGMVFSNEPAFYRENEYGIRTENMMVCVEKETTSYGRFLGFETLTLVPIDIRMIKVDLLSDVEKRWINGYNRKVHDELITEITGNLKHFLKEKTNSI